MSQHQAGSTGPTFKLFKQTALTLKVKDKATANWQEAMQDLQAVA